METNAIGTLHSYSFILKRPVESSLDVRRLVHFATRNWLRKEGLLSEWTEKAILRLEEVFPSDDHTNRSVWRIYLPHARQVLGSDLSNPDIDHPDRLNSIAWMAGTFRNQGRWKEAELLDVQVMETSKTKLPTILTR
jgi:hypothetical protein